MDVVIINDWGYTPNTRVFYIASFLRSRGYKVKLLGRRIKNTSSVFSDDIFVDVFFNKDNEFLKSTLKHILVRLQLLYHSIVLILARHPRFLMVRSLYLTIVLLFIGRMFGCKLIYDLHGYAFKELLYKSKSRKSAIVKHLERLILKKADYIITVTKYLVKEIQKHRSEDKVFMIPNGIDLSEFYRISENLNILGRYSISSAVPLVGFIGNWERWINIEELLETSRYLRKAKIVIVGEGPKLDCYKKKYPAVVFTGRVPYKDAVNLLNRFTICVLPYSNDPIIKEKSARKTYEYMAAGKPIIVNEVSGKEDFLVNGKTCITYASGDTKDLVDKIEFLLGSKALLGKLGNNNKQLVNDFSWFKLIEKSQLLRIFQG